MSEEEKEAIEYLKGKFEFFEEDDILAKWDYEAINTMLGLIDKLQKENETLKEEIKDLIEENHKHIDYIADMKKKHEDKIRTKIKELEEAKEKEEYIDEYGVRNIPVLNGLIDLKIEALKELLGGE